MIKNYRIYSVDSFFSLGVSLLLEKITSINRSCNGNDYYFLLVSNLSLSNIGHFCRTLDKDKTIRYILVSNISSYMLLNGTGIIIERFVDIAMSVSDIENEIRDITGDFRHNIPISKKPEWPVLTKNERIVLRYMDMGISMTIIAKIIGVNMKKISALKRRVMRKLGVFSIQQLMIKLCLYNKLNS